jgi:hypothetical protein
MAAACHVLAKLHHRTSHQVPALVAALQPRLHDLSPQHYSNVIWGLATLERPPPPDWAASFLAASAAALPASTAQGLANIVWALGRLELQPHAAWWEAFWAASLPVLPSASPGELAQIMHGCGRLQPPGGAPQVWGDAWLGASCEVLRASSPQELSMSIWGLDGAGVAPHKAWIMMWFLAAQAALPSCSPQVSCSGVFGVGEGS